MRFLLIVFFECVCGAVFCQNDVAVERYVEKIDSSYSIEAYSGVGREDHVKMVPMISEGTIEDEKRGLKGGFSQLTLTNAAFDTLYSIQFSDNLEKYLIQRYYYVSDKLVASRVMLKDGDRTIFSKQVYYKDDKVVFSASNKGKLKRRYAWRVEFDPLDRGYFYLKIFKEGRAK